MKKECGDISYINPQILFNLLVLPAHAHIRLKQIFASPGSARLALPAEARALRARRLRRPARRARRSGGDWVKQGLRPRTPVGGHVPRTPVSTHSVCTNFRLPTAPRGSRFLRKLAPCWLGGYAAPLAALVGRVETG